MVSEEHISKISLLTESYPRYGFDVLSLLTRMGWNALCITRLHPGYVSRKYGLSETRFLWLRSRKGKGAISPKSLGRLVKTVKTTLKKKGNQVIFLDGLEYMLMWNDLGRVLSSLKEIDGLIQGKNAEMLICIDPLTFEQRDLDRLTSEFPADSAMGVMEMFSTELSPRIGEVLPPTAGQSIGDPLEPKGLHAPP
jgi:hypothetical protein